MLRPRAAQIPISGHRYLVLDPEVVRLALAPTLALVADVTRAALVQVSLFDEDVQRVVCHTGPPGSVPAELARGTTPCEVVVTEERPVWLADGPGYPDAAAGPAAYVGVPVLGGDGATVGSLCGVSPAGTRLTSAELGRWQGLAALVADQLELLALRVDSDPERIGDPSAGAATAREISEGIAAGQIVPWFQPVVDLETGARVAVEALARWHHPTRGLLTPAAFVPVAERSGLVLDLDLDIWRQSVATLATLRRTDPELRLSVNFSARHAEVRQCPGRLAAMVSAAGLPSSAVDVEITETVHLAATGDGPAALAELRERGFGVLLDDFGTGWSTISSLLDLPHDGLKVDRSLTARSHTDPGRAALGAITAAARLEGVRTVAEGVETPEQAAAVRELGFTHGQGYHWGRPAPA